jgi:hypothetical protein
MDEEGVILNFQHSSVHLSRCSPSNFRPFSICLIAFSNVGGVLKHTFNPIPIFGQFALIQLPN